VGGIAVSILLVILLGIVQGVAEFLPISSSGHLSIIQNLFALDTPVEQNLLLDVFLHLGTLVAICLTYRKELGAMLHDFAEFIRSRNDERMDDARPTPPMRMVILIIVATLPLILVLPFRKKVELLFTNTAFIGFALIVTGLILFVSDRMIKSGTRNERTLKIRDALIIGLAQAVALIPGLSRSGATISVGMARGAQRDFAVRFSLLLSIPAVLGSAVVTFVSAIRGGADWSAMPLYLIGLVFAFAAGYVSIQVLRRVMTGGRLSRFSYYCWAVGALTIILSIVL
jgi:undecaprenyl-diphosphatase